MNVRVVERAETVVLSVKPQVMAEALQSIKKVATARQLFISIAAGIRVAKIVAALGDVQHLKRTQILVANGVESLSQGFRNMNLALVPSEANFIFIDFERDSQEVFQALLKEGIIIRPGKVWGYPTFARVTIGRMEDNQRFIKALKKIYGR